MKLNRRTSKNHEECNKWIKNNYSFGVSKELPLQMKHDVKNKNVELHLKINVQILKTHNKSPRQKVNFGKR